jgi:hypothetical protein
MTPCFKFVSTGLIVMVGLMSGLSLVVCPRAMAAMGRPHSHSMMQMSSAFSLTELAASQCCQVSPAESFSFPAPLSNSDRSVTAQASAVPAIPRPTTQTCRSGLGSSYGSPPQDLLCVFRI